VQKKPLVSRAQSMVRVVCREIIWFEKRHHCPEFLIECLVRGACTGEGKLVKRAGVAELVVEAEEGMLVERAFFMS
jgi:hypothetical protein